MAEWETIEDNEQIKAEFTGYRDGVVRLKEGGWAILPSTAAMLDTYKREFAVLLREAYIKSMEVRSNDVWVVTQPKCGTTWTQEMVWQIVHNVDLEGGKVQLFNRFPFLEFDTLMESSHFGEGLGRYLIWSLVGIKHWWDSFRLYKPSSWLGYNNCAEMLADMEERRFIKSHMPLSLLPPSLLDTSKVIYVARNPKDAMISFYYHHKLIKAHGYVGDLPTFAKGGLYLILRRKSFGFMNQEGQFIRQGKVGGWKEEFENYPEMEAQFDAWLNDQLKNSKVKFPDFS